MWRKSKLRYWHKKPVINIWKVCNKSNTTGSTCGAGTVYHSTCGTGTVYHSTCGAGTVYHSTCGAGTVYHSTCGAGTVYHSDVEQGLFTIPMWSRDCLPFRITFREHCFILFMLADDKRRRSYVSHNYN
jgi:hypothetical protein